MPLFSWAMRLPFITDLDEAMADVLAPYFKPVFLTVNKVDNPSACLRPPNFTDSGSIISSSLSSATGSGTGELLDALTEIITEEQSTETEEDNQLPRFAIIRPAECGNPPYSMP